METIKLKLKVINVILRLQTKIIDSARMDFRFHGNNESMETLHVARGCLGNYK